MSSEASRTMFANQAHDSSPLRLTGRSRSRPSTARRPAVPFVQGRLAEPPGGSYHLGERTARGDSTAATLHLRGDIV
jgi:hypothetical protein